jgi:hypothetical protein
LTWRLKGQARAHALLITYERARAKMVEFRTKKQGILKGEVSLYH